MAGGSVGKRRIGPRAPVKYVTLVRYGVLRKPRPHERSNLDVDRRRLLAWHLAGVAMWSTVLVVGFDQLITTLAEPAPTMLVSPAPTLAAARATLR